MEAHRQRQLETVVGEALARRGADRAAYLDAACGSDAELRREAESLISGEARAEDLFATPPWLGPAVPLTPGTRLGPYQIEAPVGAGGMGEVYRARDTRLGRPVAVKVLPAHLAGDPSALARFEREAKAVASLSHPNILSIYDFGRENSSVFAVTELLEGKTLRDRMSEGPLPPRKAIEFAIQMARGLGAAHDKGVIHRDLKPENVFITKDGQVKILDFGLAQLAGAGDDTSSHGPTTVGFKTQPGTVIGTVGYMAPEQVRGQATDGRADLFSLGAILFEMLTGRRAFRGPTAVETLALILNADPPPLAATGRIFSPAVELVVNRCLEKDPAERFQSAHDLAIALTASLSQASLTTELIVGPSPSRLRRTLAATGFLAAGAALALGAVAVWGSYWAAQRVEESADHFLTFSGADRSPALSRNRQYLCFTSDRDGRTRIWVRHMTRGVETPLTEGPDDFPRLSPDGTEVLFTRNESASSGVYRVPIVGGIAQQVAENAFYGDWSPAGDRVAYLRAATRNDRLVSVILTARPDGSDEREVATFDYALHHPRFSPDGKVIAAVTLSAARSPVGGAPPIAPGAPHEVFFAPIDGSRPPWSIRAPRLRRDISAVAWDGPRHVVYLQADSVVTFVGSPAQVIRQEVESGRVVGTQRSPERASVIDVVDGRVVFDTRSPRQNLREIGLGAAAGARAWLSRGNITDRQPVYGPNGDSIVFSSNRAGSFDLWRTSKTDTTLLVSWPSSNEWDPAVVDNGRRLLWSSDQGGHFECWIGNVNGGGARQLTRDGFSAENPTATPDFRWVVYASGNPKMPGLWKIRPDGTDATQLVKGDVRTPAVSPDGKYVLFRHAPAAGKVKLVAVRTEDGTPAPFDTTIVAVKPSEASLGRARWMRDGKQILFVGQDANGVTGVFVQDFVPGRDTTSTRRPFGGFDADVLTESFDVSPDGQRLLVAGWEQLFSVMELSLPSRLLSRPRGQ